MLVDNWIVYTSVSISSAVLWLILSYFTVLEQSTEDVWEALGANIIESKYQIMVSNQIHSILHLAIM